MTRIEKNQLTTLILAGGKSSRMDGFDKGLLKINDNKVYINISFSYTVFNYIKIKKSIFHI